MNNSQRGAALLVTMVAVSAFGAAAVYVMTSFTRAEKQIAQHSKVNSYRNLVASVREALFAGENCTRMLNLPVDFTGGDIQPTVADMEQNGQFFYPPDPRYWGVPVSLSYDYGPFKGPIPDPDPAKRWKIAGGTSIFDVRVRTAFNITPHYKHNTAEKLARPPGQALLRNKVRRNYLYAPLLEARYGLITLIPDHKGISLNYQHPQLVIEALLYINPFTKQLVGCFSPDGPAATCTAMGGVYNPDAATEDSRCEPDLYCKVFKSGISNPASCPAPYQADGTGSGKYICEWCNVNPQAL